MLDRLTAQAPKLATYPLLGRVASFIGGLLALWLPVAVFACLPLVVSLGWTHNLTNLMAVLTLYLAILFAIWTWGRRVRGHQRPLAAYGWCWNRGMVKDLALGVTIAVATFSLLHGIYGLLGWFRWEFKPDTPWLAVWLNGLLNGVGIAFLEELFFRGWFLAEFRHSMPLKQAAAWTSAIFATLHFLKPLEAVLATWPQWPGLWLLGMTMVQARAIGRAQPGSLGLSIGMHGGWVCTITVLSLSGMGRYNDAVPAWLTGIGGNPLASVSGLVFMAIVFGTLRWRSLQQPTGSINPIPPTV